MFKGINPKDLFNTWAERHAFLIGLFEVLCPWPAARPICKKSEKEINGEFHYYLGGRALGFVALLLILIALAKLTKEVLL